MKKIIVYGLGQEYRKHKFYLENEFDIAGYSDKKAFDMEGYIPVDKIRDYDFDFIFVTSSQYFEEIREELADKYSIEREKIIYINDILGNFQNSKVRKEWIKKKLLQIPEGSILLDAGAGQMKYAPYCKHLRYIAQDFGEYSSKTAEGGLHSDLKGWDDLDKSKLNIVCDVIDMPLEDESVDVILCSEVFEHLKNPILAVKEFGRVLKEEGQLILTAPFCSLTHMAPYFYGTGFSEYWYKDHLADAGFEINELIPFGNYFQYLSQELFRVNEMAQQYCHTQLSADEIRMIADNIKLLTKLSEHDKGSKEVLCFGMMLSATKKKRA